MLRLLQALRRRRDVPERSSTQLSGPPKRATDLRITTEMARKLFGEPEPVPRAEPDTSQPIGVPPGVKPKLLYI